MAYVLILITAISYAFASPTSIQSKWSGVSDPLIMGKNFETRFSSLALKAIAVQEERFWSGDYWAFDMKNIANRWNAGRKFRMSAPKSAAEAKTWSADELSQLSPAEKFDLFNGRYDYPLTKEVKKKSDYDAQSWEGICHGWAPASMNHNEPTPKTVTNRDGIVIPFGSSDIKGVLSYFYAYPYQVQDTHQMGRRCDNGRWNRNKDCKQDLNAGAFHIVLANRIGIEKVGFVADMDRFKEVWNHPIAAYSTEVKDISGSRSDSAPGTVKTVKVETTITYISEAGNSWETLNRTKHHIIRTQAVDYILELNAQGQIIGGEWKSRHRPDFLWIKEIPSKFTGDYARLPELLND